MYHIIFYCLCDEFIINVKILKIYRCLLIYTINFTSVKDHPIHKGCMQTTLPSTVCAVCITAPSPLYGRLQLCSSKLVLHIKVHTNQANSVPSNPLFPTATSFCIRLGRPSRFVWTLWMVNKTPTQERIIFETFSPPIT